MLTLNNDVFPLGVDHTYLYAHLMNNALKRKFETITTVALLSDEVKFLKYDKDNRAKMKQILTDLKTFNLITFSADRVGANTRLEITYPGLSQIKGKFTGKISSELLALTPQQFYIVVYIKKWQRKKSYRIPLSEFAHMMNCSVSTVQKNIKELKLLNIIEVHSGRYKQRDNGEFMQEENRYTIKPREYWFKKPFNWREEENEDNQYPYTYMLPKLLNKTSATAG
jgi:hypothetical protein